MSSPRTRSADRGSASVWLLAMCGVVLIAAAAAVLRAEAVLVRHRVEGAADLAALAAAERIGIAEDSCAAARSIAAVNGGVLDGCVLTVAADGRSGVVEVHVRRSVRLTGVGITTVTASARAGRDAPE